MKLYNGDCDNVLDLLIQQGVKVDAIITDPPFNLLGKLGTSMHMFRQGEKQENSSMTEENMSFDREFDQLTWLSKIKKVLKKGGNIVIFNDWENMGDIAKELRIQGIKVKSLNHWQKKNPVPAEWKRRFVTGREYFLYATNGGNNTFNVESLHKGVFDYALTKQSEKANGKHPNQKPIEMMEELVKILTNEKETVLDICMGSGSTGVACKKLNRNFIGIELDKKYYDLSVRRLKELTWN